MYPRTLCDLYTEDLTRSHKLSRKKAWDWFCLVLDILSKESFPTPWPLKDFGSFFCLLEYDIQTCEDFSNFVEAFIPANKEERSEYFVFCDHLILLFQSWNYFSALKEENFRNIVEKFRLNTC